MDDNNTNSLIHESASLCESESSSVANMNYSGPDLEADEIVSEIRDGGGMTTNGELEQKTVIVLFCHTRYIKSFNGVLRLLQVVSII